MISIYVNTGYIVSVHCPFVWYKPSRWLSFLLRLFLQSYYQHTAAIIEIWGEIYVIEANPKIIPVKWEDFTKDKIIKITRPAYADMNTLEFQRKLAKLLMSRSGGQYDYVGTLWHQLIYQVTGVWIGRKSFNSESKLYCSEYIAWAYHRANTNIFNEYWKTTPKDIVNNINFLCVYEGLAKDLIANQNLRINNQ